MINWIVKILDNYSEVSDYTLEYSSALLMNLAIRTSGKIKCENPKVE